MKLKSLRYYLPESSLPAIGIISFIILYFMIWQVDAAGYKSMIGGDGKDYYSYLISIFIDHNLGHQDTNPWYITQTPTGTINVHTIGVSLLLLPFFGIACLWAYISGDAITGMSDPFEKMINLGALAYLLIGLYFLRKLLLRYEIKNRAANIILLLVFFGTNLLNYTLHEPTMSHVYSFSLITTFLYFAKCLFDQPTSRYAIVCALILGLIVLVRPANILIVLALPMLNSSFETFVLRIKQIVIKNWKSFIFSILVFLSVIFLQSIVWFMQNGKIMQWTYQDNGFYFLNPHMLKMLFGFNGGFFIYTPICLLFLAGIFFWHKINKFQSWAAFSFLLFLFYFLSSYWGYTYNDGLGIRPICDYYTLFAIPGAMLFDGNSGVLKKVILYGLSISALLLNLIYCYQYKTGILEAANMNYNKWSYIFLHTDKSYQKILGGCNDLPPYSTNPVLPTYTFTDSIMGNKWYSFNDSIPARELFNLSQIGFNSNKLFLKIKLKVKEFYLGSSQNALVLIKTSSPEENPKIAQSFRLNETPFTKCCEWKTWEYNVIMPGDFKKENRFEVIILNDNKKSFFVNGFQIELFNYKTNRDDHN